MKKTINIIVLILRVFVGLVFIFSGFVKAVDPLGSTYKFIDYFTAFNIPGLHSAAFYLAFILSGLEFTLGVCMVLFIQNKLANWGTLLFMTIFTPLTLWLALKNPVHDCGCFGDAIILTNWQTFYKNIIILIPVIISFIYRKRTFRWVNLKTEWIITAVVAFLITGFSVYNYEHLPVLDFRPYKVGTYIPGKMFIPQGAPKDVYEQYITLKDTTTGKNITLDINKYTNDSIFWCEGTKWKYISTSDPKLIKEGFHPSIHDFNIVSNLGEDITQQVLSDPDYYFILIAYDLNNSRTKNQSKINELYTQATAYHHKFICLTSSIEQDIKNFKNKWKTQYNYYITDPITLKTIIRANPGLVLLHKGTILAKWNSNDIPLYETIKVKYLK